MVKIFRTFSTKFFGLTGSIRSTLFILTLFCFVSSVSAANISLLPAAGAYKTGKNFTVDISLSNNQDTINAISGVVTFPSDILQVVSLSKTGSLLGLWAEEPVFSNTDGTISFEGVSLNPGFSGTSGKILTVTFKPKQAGKASVFMKSGSVLANDGNATNVLGTLGSATFIIDPATEEPLAKPPVTSAVVSTTPSSSALTITSSTYPDSNAWYSSREASFAWTLPSGATAVRTLYDDKPLSNPSKVFDPAITNRSFTVDTDGIMYMHVQAKTSSGWGPVAHYTFQVDSHAPENLKALFTDGSVNTNPTPTVLVTGTDALSGLDHVTMSVDGDQTITYSLESTHLYRLPRQTAGKHTVVISLYDKAGNGSQVSLDYTIQVIAVPVITDYTRHIELGGVLEVHGTTYPQTTVEIVLKNTDNNVFSETVVSDDKGNFVLSWQSKLATGVYEMRARVLDSKGATSDFTDVHVVTLEQLALIRVGIFIMNWLSLVLIILIAVMAIVATFWYSFIEFARFRRKIRRTLTDVENTLKVNVQALRRDVEEFHTILVKAEKKRDLTKEEQMILKKFKKRLEITEQEIEKKLEQIG